MIEPSYLLLAPCPDLAGARTLATHAVMAGSLAARPPAGLAGRLYLATDTNGGTLYRDSGASWVQAAGAVTSSGITVLGRSTSQVTLGNTTAETSLYSLTVPGGALGTTGLLRVSMAGTVVQGTGTARNLTLRLKYGGATAAIIIHAVASGTTTGIVRLEAVLFAAGATNAQRAYGRSDFYQGAAGLVANPPTTSRVAAWQGSGDDSLAIDSTTDQTLELTGQWSGTMEPSTAFKSQLAIVELA
ncbi:MAG TPA: hypothetical protein VFC51_16340 [Chloroflexota bacterium]|nr:hypothetical protein [Chloroflexota bacterium]